MNRFYLELNHQLKTLKKSQWNDVLHTQEKTREFFYSILAPFAHEEEMAAYLKSIKWNTVVVSLYNEMVKKLVSKLLINYNWFYSNNSEVKKLADANIEADVRYAHESFSDLLKPFYDELTNLHNLAFLRKLERTHKWEGCLFYIDVDNFKWVNDTYWHESWDCILLETWKFLKSIVRNTDYVIRKSWDEFILFIASNDITAIERIQSRLVDGFCVNGNLNQKFISWLQINFSFWFEFINTDKAWSDSLWTADNRLYQMKSGKKWWEKSLSVA